MDLRERREQSNRHPWEVARSRFFRRVIAEASPTPPRSVIDVGSGDGWFAEQLLADLAPGATIDCWDIHYTADDLAAPLATGIRRTVTRPAAQAPLVTALDVIEHVDDDAAFVADTIAPLVAPGGLLVVSVPAHPRLFTSHDVALGHYRRYTRSGLHSLLGAHFEIVRSGSLFTSLLIPRTASAGLEKLRPPTGTPTIESAWSHGRGITRLITSTLELDTRLGLATANRRWRPAGLSEWAVCRPRVA